MPFHFMRRYLPLFAITINGKTTHSKIALATIILLLSLLVSFDSRAAEDTIRLVCEISSSLKNDTMEDSSGEVLVTVKYNPNRLGRARMLIHESAATPPEFDGTITEEEITGHVEWQDFAGMRLTESVRINRFTGSYQSLFGVGEGESKSPLIFFGKCKSGKKLF